MPMRSLLPLSAALATVRMGADRPRVAAAKGAIAADFACRDRHQIAALRAVGRGLWLRRLPDRSEERAA